MLNLFYLPQITQSFTDKQKQKIITMLEKLIEFYATRVGKYVIYFTVLWTSRHFLGFEETCLFALAFIAVDTEYNKK